MLNLLPVIFRVSRFERVFIQTDTNLLHKAHHWVVGVFFLFGELLCVCGGVSNTQ